MKEANKMNLPNFAPSRLDQFARITQVASGLSIIIGIIFTVAQLYKISLDQQQSARSAKMNALATVRELINEDTDVRLKMDAFLHEPGKIAELARPHPAGVKPMYSSPEMKDLRDAGHHYEVMGAMVKSGYVDFDFIYDVVEFPDDFWSATEKLRKQANENWSNGNGLSDFWANFRYLRCRYDTRRHGKREPSDVCRSS